MLQVFHLALFKVNYWVLAVAAPHNLLVAGFCIGAL
jgi:hypothetical protein